MKKSFASGPRVVKIYYTRVFGKKTLFMEFRQFLDLELIVNVYATLYWFLIQAFSIDSKEATIKRLP